ncbi:MAG TPA: MFS transporter [Candidatus Limnocylindrales bacterium]|nr:MFS transporter [Candidatus Limnocylindrales bacterium]
MSRSLWSVLLGTFTLRFATGVTGVMLQAYLADLPKLHPGTPAVSAETVGLFAATFYVAELVLSPIFGILSDRLGHRRLMQWGPIFGGVAVAFTTVSPDLLVIGGARLLQGASTAASIPSILGYIAIATAGSEALRGRAASRFEGATLAGLGLGFIVALPLFDLLGTGAFLLNVGFYGVAFAIYRFGVEEPPEEREAVARPHVTLKRYLEVVTHSNVLLLAPTWIAVNASIGLWFSQSIFQLVKADPRFPDQWLLQGFSGGQIATGAIVIAVIFGAGILWWGNRFDKYRRTTIIGLGVFGGIGLVVAAGIINHVAYGASGNMILTGLVIVAAVIVVAGLFGLAGATPAAVGLLADVSEQFPGDRGAIMGLYSVFLAIGQITGSLLGGVAADKAGMDGLIVATGILLVVALVPLSRLRRVEHYLTGPAGAAELV